ncbi:hypothetical protein PAXRUDRAFT_60329, partial [Paxillus rubicundulus Ve08.2h10]
YQAAPPTKDGIPLPPGPPARWFWQNAFPTSDMAHTFENLVVQYGPVVSLREGSQVIIVIGRMDAATEIMEKEGAALIDRPRLIAFGEIMSGNMRMLVISGGERFRRLRKTMHTHLQPKAAEAYQDIQRDAAKEAIIDILNDPDDHIRHFQRFAAAVILRVAYGKSTPTSNDDAEVVRLAKDFEHIRAVIRPGTFLVDRIPFLRYVPGYGRILHEYHEFELSLFRDQLARVADDMSRGEAGPSFGKTLLENIHEHGLS